MIFNFLFYVLIIVVNEWVCFCICVVCYGKNLVLDEFVIFVCKDWNFNIGIVG